MEQKRKNKMGVEPMIPLILKMSLPAMLSMFIQALYNVVDSIFVSRISKEGANYAAGNGFVLNFIGWVIIALIGNKKVFKNFSKN